MERIVSRWRLRPGRVVWIGDEHDPGAGVQGAQHPFEGEGEVARQRNLHDTPAHGVGTRRVHVEGRDHDNRFVWSVLCAASQRGNAGGEDPFVKTVGQCQLLFFDAEVLARTRRWRLNNRDRTPLVRR